MEAATLFFLLKPTSGLPKKKRYLQLVISLDPKNNKKVDMSVPLITSKNNVSLRLHSIAEIYQETGNVGFLLFSSFAIPKQRCCTQKDLSSRVCLFRNLGGFHQKTCHLASWFCDASKNYPILSMSESGGRELSRNTTRASH
jgi:hypothetical protein